MLAARVRDARSVSSVDPVADFVQSTQSLKKFEVIGGVVSGTEESRGKISLDRPNRQWDYPYVFLTFSGAYEVLTTILRYAWYDTVILYFIGLTNSSLGLPTKS